MDAVKHLEPGLLDQVPGLLLVIGEAPQVIEEPPLESPDQLTERLDIAATAAQHQELAVDFVLIQEPLPCFRFFII